VRAFVTPEDAAADHEQQCDDDKFGAGDALLTAITVIPGDDKHEGQTDQER
jgi:hypothetical protein